MKRVVLLGFLVTALAVSPAFGWTGAFTINGDSPYFIAPSDGKASWSGWDHIHVYLLERGPYVFKGECNERTFIAETDCTIVLDGVWMESSFRLNNGTIPAIDCNGHTVTLVLKGENKILGYKDQPAIKVEPGSRLVINDGGSGALQVTGGLTAAAIGGRAGCGCGTVEINGGVITAQGGSVVGGDDTYLFWVTRSGAAIGGGNGGAGGTVIVNGGTVTTTGGGNSAAIGGGKGGAGGTVKVFGGVVVATGGDDSAGIGGGKDGAAGSVEIHGGTVVATRGDADSADIGHGDGADASDADHVLIYGGNVWPTTGSFLATPWSYGQTTLACVTIPGFTPGNLVTVSNLSCLTSAGVPYSYSGEMTVTDDGCVHLWLPPAGTNYAFFVDGAAITVAVPGTDAVTATRDVTVNSIGLAMAPGDGWTYTDGVLHLNGAGPYVLAGSNTTGSVKVLVDGVANCAVTLNGLSLSTGATEGSGVFVLTNDASVALTLVGANSLISGRFRAGITVPVGASLVVGGRGSLAVAANGYGAGIGGDSRQSCGAITITNGLVTARTAHAAGIGAGYMAGAAGDITISGGSVVAENIEATGCDLGDGAFFTGTAAGRVVLSGGSIHAVHGAVTNLPVNAAAARVFCVTVTGLVANAAQTVIGLPSSYGVGGLASDADGNLYLWLPVGNYAFTVNGREYVVTVGEEGDASSFIGIGVSVGGTDIGVGSGAGWSYDGTTLALTGSGPYVVSGSNVRENGSRTNAVLVSVQADCALVASNLTIDVSSFYDSGYGVTALDCGGHAVTLELAGQNAFQSGKDRAGIFVSSAASLLVTNLDDAATLAAFGGFYGAGIGGCYQATNGPVTIAGGIVTAIGDMGAGIGGGAFAVGAAGGKITVTGGTVFARDSVGHACDLGSGMGVAVGPAVVFTGGSIHAARGVVTNAPVNAAGARLWCVTVGGFPVTNAAAPVVLAGLPAGYGAHGLVPDESGRVYLWLTNGVYAFTVNESGFWATVADADTTAVQHLRLTVDGAAVGTAGGTGWAFAGTTLSLTNARSYVLDGSNVAADGATTNAVTVRATSACSVFATNLVLDLSSVAGSALDGGTAGLTLAGGTFTLGGGSAPDLAGAVTIVGGSVKLLHGTFVCAPSNGTERVWCVTVPGLGAGSSVALSGLSSSYNGNAISADESGAVYLWLPDGYYTFTANADAFTVTVAGADVTATRRLGVTVNGADIGAGAGPGWTFDGARIVLGADASVFVLSGERSDGAYRVVINGGTPAITLSNLVLSVDSIASVVGVFSLGDSAAATLALVGTNELVSGMGYAGLSVPTGTSLVVTGPGLLTVQGGIGAAAIGGGLLASSGPVTVRGGRIDALGGNGAATIGGGMGAAGGALVISGGTLAAPAPQNGTGLNGGSVVISGGSVNTVIATTITPVDTAGTTVTCVTLDGLAPEAPVLLDGLSGYGTNDVWTDDSGAVHLWLPQGDHLAAAGAGTNAFIKCVDVSSEGAATVVSNAVLTITGFDENSVTNWTPFVLNTNFVRTAYATNLVQAVWSFDRPTNTPSLFMRLEVK